MVSTALCDQHMRPLLVSKKDAGVLLNVGQTKIWQMITRKRLEVVYLDGRTLITLTSIERLVQELREEAANKEPSTFARKARELGSRPKRCRSRGRGQTETHSERRA